MKERLDTIMSFLSSKTDDYNIEGWVQSYITSAEETLTTIADYLDKNPEVQNESRASTGASHNINQDDVKKGAPCHPPWHQNPLKKALKRMGIP